MKKESLGTVLVTVLTVPRPLCFCFFLMVFSVTFFPLVQSITQLRSRKHRGQHQTFWSGQSWRVRPYTDPLSVHTQDTSPSASPFISVPILRSIQAPHYWTNNPKPSQDRKSEGGRRGGGRPPGIQEGDRMMYHGITRLFSALKDMEQL